MRRGLASVSRWTDRVDIDEIDLWLVQRPTVIDRRSRWVLTDSDDGLLLMLDWPASSLAS